MEHLLGSHLEDHIGMSAHPDAALCNFAQQRVEIGAVASLMDRVNPDEQAIESGKLRADGVDDLVLVNHRFCVDIDMSERREDGLEAARLARGAAALHFIA